MERKDRIVCWITIVAMYAGVFVGAYALFLKFGWVFDIVAWYVVGLILLAAISFIVATADKTKYQRKENGEMGGENIARMGFFRYMALDLDEMYFGTLFTWPLFVFEAVKENGKIIISLIWGTIKVIFIYLRLLLFIELLLRAWLAPRLARKGLIAKRQREREKKEAERIAARIRNRKRK